ERATCRCASVARMLGPAMGLWPSELQLRAVVTRVDRPSVGWAPRAEVVLPWPPARGVTAGSAYRATQSGPADGADGLAPPAEICASPGSRGPHRNAFADESLMRRSILSRAPLACTSNGVAGSARPGRLGIRRLTQGDDILLDSRPDKLHYSIDQLNNEERHVEPG